MTELSEHPFEIQTGAGDALNCIMDSRTAVASLVIDFPKRGPDVGTAKKVCLPAVSGAVPGDSVAAAFKVATRTLITPVFLCVFLSVPRGGFLSLRADAVRTVLGPRPSHRRIQLLGLLKRISQFTDVMPAVLTLA
jgi:hypothetical protein